MHSKGPGKSRGISMTAEARTLGVTREHLSRVLHGHRVSKRLLLKHAELLASHAKAAAHREVQP